MFVNSLKDNKNDNDEIGIKMAKFLDRVFFIFYFQI